MKDCYDRMYSCDWVTEDLQIYRQVFLREKLGALDSSLESDSIDMNLMDSLTALRGVSPTVKLCLLALQDLH